MVVRFKSPIFVRGCENGMDDGYDIYNHTEYKNEIHTAMQNSMDSIFDDEDAILGILTYTDSELIKKYVLSTDMFLVEKQHSFELDCCVICMISDEITENHPDFAKLISDIEDEITGQYSDGWGEGFEQSPIIVKDNWEKVELYVSFWDFNDWEMKHKIITEEEAIKQINKNK